MQWDGHIPFYTIGIAGTDRAKRLAEWGTYGKHGDNPLTYVKLIDCSTEHLQAILQTQKQIWGTDYELLIREILKDRDAVQPGNLGRQWRANRIKVMFATIGLLYGFTTLFVCLWVAYLQRSHILHPHFLLGASMVSLVIAVRSGQYLRKNWE